MADEHKHAPERDWVTAVDGVFALLTGSAGSISEGLAAIRGRCDQAARLQAQFDDWVCVARIDHSNPSAAVSCALKNVSTLLQLAAAVAKCRAEVIAAEDEASKGENEKERQAKITLCAG